MKTKMKRHVSLLLVLAMVLSLFSVNIFAADTTNQSTSSLMGRNAYYVDNVPTENKSWSLENAWTASIGYTNEIYFHFVDETGGDVAVTADKLKSSNEDVVSLSACSTDSNATRLEVKAFGTAAIQYVADDGLTYEFTVNSDLPNYGFYSTNTASKESYITEYTIKTLPVTLYFISANNVTLSNLELGSFFSEFASITSTAATTDGTGTVAEITITGVPSQDMIYQISGSEGSGSSFGTGIKLIDGTPGLGIRFNGPQGENTGDSLTKSLTNSPNCSGDVFFYFRENGQETRLSASDLVSSDTNIVTIEEATGTTGAVRLTTKAFGKATINYTKDGNTYEFPVTCDIPEVGFYSNPEATQANYIDSFTYKDDNKVLYLVLNNRTTLKSVTLGTEFDNIADVEISSDKKYATITMTAEPANHTYELQAVFEDDGQYQGGIELKNGNPYIAIRHPGYGESGPVEDKNNSLDAFHVVFPGTSEELYFYYVDGEGNETNLKASDLTSSDESIASLSDSEQYTNVVRLDSNAFGEATLTYKTEDGKEYSLKVTSTLPDTGFYSKPEATEGNFILDFTVTETNNTFYFIAIKDITFSSIALEEQFDEIADLELSADKTCATITVTGDPVSGPGMGGSYGITGAHTNAMGFRCGITLKNGKNSGTIGDNLTWKFENGVLTVSGNGAMTGAPSVWKEREITKVVIEEGVTTIYDWAFSNIPMLKEISLPSTLNSIGYQAFYGCGLEEITIPNGVTDLGYEAFAYCQSLKKVTLSDNIENVGYGIFADCAALSEVHLPANATRIGVYTFKNCGKLTSITLPETLETIDEEAFMGSGLQYINLPDSVVTFGAWALGYNGDGTVNSSFRICGGSDEAKAYATNNGLVYKHSLKNVAEKAATYTASGMKAHWECSDCGRVFLDEAGTQQTTADQLVIPQLIEVVNNKAEVSEGAVDEAIESAGTSTTVTLPLTKAEDEVASAEIPVAALDKVVEAEKELVIETNEATVILDNKALEEVVKSAGTNETITIEVKKVPDNHLNNKQKDAVKDHDVKGVISAEIICGGKNISDFGGGTVTVKIPYSLEKGEKGEHYRIMYVADDGKTEDIKTEYKDGHFVAELKHFSEYVIIKNEVKTMTFTDVKESDWFYKEVEYAFQNSLMIGEGNNLFVPEGEVTRGTVATVLYRLAGSPAVTGKQPFTDVAADAWYSDAVIWANEAGVMIGVGNNKFEPDTAITREQMDTALHRYHTGGISTASEKPNLTSFPDYKLVSDYAETAMAWAVEEEIIKGDAVNGVINLNPAGNATRAQLAAILTRYMKKF